VEPFFDLVYALAIFAALAVAGAVPGFLLGLALPDRERLLVTPAFALAFAGWIWAGWIESPHGISRIGLVVFAAVGAAGFVKGWLVGLRLGGDVRRRLAAG
jgi:hypothetical protein